MDMSDTLRHTIDGDKFIIEMISNRFTYDLVEKLKTMHPFAEMGKFNTIEFNLEQVKMIDSSSIGFLFELHNKLKDDYKNVTLIISVGKNKELKSLLHKFQVDILLNIQ